MNAVRRPESRKRSRERFASIVTIRVRKLSRNRSWVVTLSFGGLRRRVSMRLVIMLGRLL